MFLPGRFCLIAVSCQLSEPVGDAIPVNFTLLNNKDACSLTILYYKLEMNVEVVVVSKLVRRYLSDTSSGSLLIFLNSYQFSCHGNRVIDIGMGEKNHLAKPGGLSKSPWALGRTQWVRNGHIRHNCHVSTRISTRISTWNSRRSVNERLLTTVLCAAHWHVHLERWQASICYNILPALKMHVPMSRAQHCCQQAFIN
eukprot:sb/3470735/